MEQGVPKYIYLHMAKLFSINMLRDFNALKKKSFHQIVSIWGKKPLTLITQDLQKFNLIKGLANCRS